MLVGSGRISSCSQEQFSYLSVTLHGRVVECSVTQVSVRTNVGAEHQQVLDISAVAAEDRTVQKGVVVRVAGVDGDELRIGRIQFVSNSNCCEGASS